MADQNARQAKLTQYLTEAYSKEKELEIALQTHIAITTRPPYKKRLKEHLRETKSHATQLQRRIKKLGGSVPTVTATAAQLAAIAKGPAHILRGSGESEKMLKNAKTEYFHEHEEIATYTAIETVAKSLKDRETERLASSIRRDEERMARFLERQIPSLARAVVKEIPAEGGQGGTSASKGARRGTRKSARKSAGKGTRKGSSRRK
jgi:ferritin-like metal-binding protein YciE